MTISQINRCISHSNRHKHAKTCQFHKILCQFFRSLNWINRIDINTFAAYGSVNVFAERICPYWFHFQRHRNRHQCQQHIAITTRNAIKTNWNPIKYFIFDFIVNSCAIVGCQISVQYDRRGLRNASSIGFQPGLWAAYCHLVWVSVKSAWKPSK